MGVRSNGPTATGLDRLLRDGPVAAGLREGARIGLLAHAASVDGAARPAHRALLDDGRLRLVRLFAPEHGLWGHEQDMESVASARDPWSGLPVVSLYGADAGSLRPAAASLAGLDALLVDLQDVGSRYYTYVYTMAYAMEAAAEVGLPVVVLDRPNPLGGLRVEGPGLERALTSFVGRFPLPVRHGMTAGELARRFARVERAGAVPRVVELEGWDATRGFEATGLPWVPPSPNMPTTRTATVYPGGCLVEGTTLSEGRGTTTPFELVGAPGLDAPRLADALTALELPDVRFRPASFRPMFQKHAGRGCLGVQVIPTGDAFRPVETYVGLILAAREQDPAAADWRREPYEFEHERLAIDLLLGRADLRPRIEAGESLERLAAAWADDAAEFRRDREPDLLYPRD